MPFIGDLASGSSDDEPDTLGAQTPSKHKMETRWGGFGDVYFVRIHPNSHNFQGVFGPLLSPEGPFALKKLRGGSNNEQNEKEFKKEEEMLTRFDGTVHPHIVTILMTYKHGNRYCFLFPRAECDLIDYFEQNPSPKNDLKTARWLAKQCLHLTEAVHLIHNPPKQDSLKPDKRKYGRHGDIKAENILLFKSNSNEYDLVLSDFGLGSMHHDWSKSNIPNKDISATPEFRPPECEMEGGCISRAFDIWTLGCLFLDLLTWFLGGEELRLQFQKKRTTPYIRGPDTPLYFEVVKTKDERHGFIVKEQVKDVSKYLLPTHRLEADL
ncbi:CTD kinase subunit alpha [Daldinia childiae]|uniref:CTD kinase subunit alpha n=1 Tax=Daldinia childiae TaxID=326645 RepID=UPI001447DE2F|nr:CTD kinase subunit alpha [Daldinia childiae]KAF3059969.1 CTD kinase subunit alpha [Daldinia childiae]